MAVDGWRAPTEWTSEGAVAYLHRGHLLAKLALHCCHLPLRPLDFRLLRAKPVDGKATTREKTGAERVRDHDQCAKRSTAPATRPAPRPENTNTQRGAQQVPRWGGADVVINMVINIIRE